MSVINILSPHVADMIAAGEVVERPASVIKELMENSFDAGASAVTVEIKGGGATYIRISDNGCGMAPEDAGIAFMRHATSKLRDEHGLEAIGTMGFRGEALAAISAVSEIMELAIRAFKENDISVAYRVEPLEEHIDDLCDEMKIRHVTRLKAGICSLEQGFPFTDLLTNFERVADHCSNIALALIELDKDAYDTHSYVLDLKEMRAHDFDRYFAEYSERFSI